ncbi:hypothetical protein OL229_11790 [Neisseriaceae bacterium JH1-16]|nr:hypothetical protein [Neisseriaceae bacterium JH1-16]
MGDALAGRRTDIDTDVVAIRPVVALEQRAGLVEQAQQRLLLCVIGIEIAGDVAVRDNQQMARRDRVTVETRVREGIVQYRTIRIAERTARDRIAHLGNPPCGECRRLSRRSACAR